MFDFEDAGEAIKLLASWLLLSAAIPGYYKLALGENILFQMLRTADGLGYFAMSFLLALVSRPVLNRFARRENIHI